MRKPVIAIPAMCAFFMPAIAQQEKITRNIPDGDAHLTPEASAIINDFSSRTTIDRERAFYKNNNTRVTLQNRGMVVWQ